MANYCSVERPPQLNQDQWVNWVVSPFYNGMYGANANAPFVFNADAYAITCVAFPSAGGSGGSLTSQQGEIDTLKTAMLNVQNEMAALTAGSITQAPNTDMLVAQAGVFGAFLVAGIAVLSLKWLYNLFRHRHDID